MSRIGSGGSFRAAVGGSFALAESTLDGDPTVLRLEPGEETSGPRYTSREVLDLLGVKQREVRQWLGPPYTEIKGRDRSPTAGTALRPTTEAQEGGLVVEAASPQPETGQRHQAHTAARYSVNDLRLLRSAKELRRSDVPARKIRAAFASLKRRLPAGNSPLALQLVAEGKKVIVRDDGGTWDAESGQFMFDFASTHSLWPLDVAVPEANASGELNYARSGEPSPAPRNVLTFASRRNRDATAHEWYERARELELAGEKGAVSAYQEALRLDPEMIDAQIDLGRYLHERGDLKQARVHYELALEADETSATASFNRAVILEDLGQHERAVEAYTHTLERDPMYADAYYNLARLYEIRGDRSAALRCLQSYRRVTRG